MRLATALVALAVFVVAAFAADAAAPGFRYGVAAGEVTSTSAILWTRAPASGAVRLELHGDGSVRWLTLRARPSDDLTVQARVGGLRPATPYFYRFRQRGAVSRAGRFVTAPARSRRSTIRFAVSGDADATPGPDGKPAFNGYQVYGRMAAEQNAFNVNLGDTIYADSDAGDDPPAKTVAERWAKYRLGLELAPLRELRATAALYSQWDDHEFVNDFSRAVDGESVYRAGAKAFRDYSPVAYSSRLGLYRSVRWGRNLELFFLDERSFRSPEVSAACGEDLAPTAPQSVRDEFSLYASSLKTPVSEACRAAIADPRRTVLGRTQYAAFTRAVAASTATWKVIVNEGPIQQFYENPYDRWEGYAAERMRLLRFLQKNVRNVFFVTTDSHANLVNVIRYTTLGGPPRSSGMWEVVTGPVARKTWTAEGRRLSAFFRPPPPKGMGMRCASLDTYSYAEVTVTGRTLTVALRDDRGRPVRQARGAACPPLVLRAR